MFQCTICLFSSSERKVYTKHVSYFHKYPGYIPTYKCSVDGCNRSYSSIKSFYKHINQNVYSNKPAITQFSQPENVLIDSVESEVSQFANSSNKPDTILNSFKNSFNQIAIKLYADENIPSK